MRRVVPKYATAKNAHGAGDKNARSDLRISLSQAANAGVADMPLESIAEGPEIKSERAASVLSALRSVGLSAGECQRIVRRRPQILRLSTQDSIEPVFAYLRDVLGMSDKQIRSVLMFGPQIFCHVPQREFPARVQLLEHQAYIASAQLPATIAKCPHILWMNLSCAAAVVDAIVAACPLLPTETLGSLFARVPQALLGPPEDIARNLTYVEELIGGPTEMARVVAKIPLVLVFSRKTIDRRVAILRGQLGLGNDVVSKVIIAQPDILQWSIDGKISVAIDKIARVVGREAVSDVIIKLPAILGSVDSIHTRVKWLKKTVGLSDNEVLSVVRRAPAVLVHSIESNLKPKWSFITKTMGGGKNDVLEAPVEIFCASLQQRAMPRYAFMMSKRLADVKDHSVVDILRGSDADFCRDVAKCEPSEYREYVDDDVFLLFFSQLI